MSAADWMRDLPSEVKANRPLNQLVIPGSHDSFTYQLDKHLPVGPDTDKEARRLGNLFPCVKSIIYRWSRCQKMDVEDQLTKGIRYFDIRLGILPEKYCNRKSSDGEENLDKFRIIHALYGESISTPFDKIMDFLKAHSDEVIILDFQHTYSFTDEDHNFLVEKIQTLFKDMLCPRTEIMSNLTLDFMKKKGYRVIAIYPKMAATTRTFLWPRALCPTPWANTTKLEVLEPFLKEGLEKRDDKNAFFVSQAILTPTSKTVTSHLTSSLEKSLAKKCDAFAVKWLSGHPSNLNIVIVDFMDKDDITNIIIHQNI